MTSLTTPQGVDREGFVAWYRRNRARSLFLFDRVAPEAYESRPIPLRNPPVFYEGHLPAFSFNKLVKEALHKPSIDAAYEVLFERGIDPAPKSASAVQVQQPRWPSRAEVQAFGAKCDAAVEDALLHGEIAVASDPMLERAHAAWTILEHEPMHHETFAYLLHRMPFAQKYRPAEYRAPLVSAAPSARRVEISAGTATLGVRRDAVVFAWDNEFEETVVHVDRFECDVYPVTNEQWLRFVRDGGPIPSFWVEDRGSFKILGAWELLPFLPSAPVWVTGDQARAYATWDGRRVMSEAEYHRAAFGTPSGEERPFPWGEASPANEHGNFDWQSWDAEPVGSRPAGASGWGIHELIGNGWEHTTTPFAPLPGFTPHASYQPYSADFFDGKHYVVKGASPVTPTAHIRRSFRNWYYGDYPFLYAKFRTVG